MARREAMLMDDMEARVAKALKKLDGLLEQERARPVIAAEAAHTYDDKYVLAEMLTSLSAASQLQTLEHAGATWLDALYAAAAKKEPLTLRLSVRETCKLLRKEQYDEDSASKHVAQGVLGKTTHKVVTTVTQWRWALGYAYEVFVFSGPVAQTADGPFVVAKRDAVWEVVTRSDKAPRPEVRRAPELDCSLTWLLSRRDAGGKVAFAIDRAAATTPRRNADVAAALDAAADLGAWCDAAAQKLEDLGASALPKAAPSSSSSGAAPPAAVRDAALVRDPLFVPVVPLMRESDEEGSASLTAQDVALLLEEEKRALVDRAAKVSDAYPAPSVLEEALSAQEATLVALLRHIRETTAAYAAALRYVEGMLRNQLVAALGKTLTAADFGQFMRHHERQLYAPAYAPQPFCFAVRQAGHSPEGTMSLEVAGGDRRLVPIETLHRRFAEPVAPMSFAIDAATTVRFGGERFLHVYMPHAFADTTTAEVEANYLLKPGRRRPPIPHRKAPELTLNARARQFSSFMIVVGRLGPNRTFEPKQALIVRNKDDVKIPLILEQMPSAKEFKDAISSLSPEQRRFCQAYRAMQLEGSVFGVLTIQLRPQLEKVLRLDADGLTKRIALTQRLLELFIEYQIPSDLLSYDGPANASNANKLAAVEGHVQAIFDTIDAAKKAEVDAAKRAYAYENPQDALRAENTTTDDAPVVDDDGDFLEQEEVQDDCMIDATPKGRLLSASNGGLFGAIRGGGGPRHSMASSSSVSMTQRRFKSSAAAPPPPPPPPPRVMMAMAMSAPAAGGIPPPLLQEKGGAPPPESAPAPAAPARTQQQQQPPPARRSQEEAVEPSLGFDETDVEPDLTLVPATLDAQFEKYDLDSSLRPTKILVGETWTRTSQRALVSPATTTEMLHAEDQKTATKKAFDLLDALSRSGALPIDCCTLHAVIAATHCFDASLMDTLVVANVNPIEKLERSSLIIASTVHAASPDLLVNPAHLPRLLAFSAPHLLRHQVLADGTTATGNDA